MKTNVAPAAAPKLLAAHGVYRPNAQMSINQQRAAELYPHRLITPEGVGNGIEYGHGFGRGK